MALSIQYYNGTDYTQFGLDVADYTITGWQGSKVATVFNAVKDSKDTVYIMCGDGANLSSHEVTIIAIDKDGTKRVTKFSDDSYSCSLKSGITTMQLSRDEQHIFVNLFRVTDGSNGYVNLIKFPTNFQQGVDIPFPHTEYYYREYNANFKFAIYQDRYIWVASGTTVKIYDYKTKVSLDSDGVAIVASLAFCADYSNTSVIAYSISANILSKLSFNTVDTITKIDYTMTNKFTNAKQILIDKWGDLVIITNTGTASQLLKYTNVGVEKDVLTLGGAFYNLNTDNDGNYYYSNALGTYKITANTAQGQAYYKTKSIEESLIITGYNPAVFGPQE